MLDRIPEFFDRFKEDFKTFDGELISNRFCTPFVAVDANGKISNLESEQAIACYFQHFLDDYRSRGVVSCSYKALEITPINRCCLLATVTWELFDQQGIAVIEWRETYSLVESHGALKVLATYDH